MPDPHLPIPTDALLQRARQLPKVLLHEHLDGGLRVATLLDLLRERGIASPAPDADSLAAWFDARAHAGSLVEYLRGFDLTVAAMATPEALARVAFEAAEDARAEGCVLAEFRIAPLLFEAHGVPGEVAVAAMLHGLSQSPLPAGPAGLIVCAMRHDSDARIAQAAGLAIACHQQPPAAGAARVVGFDLAGPEAGWPASRHAALLARVRQADAQLALAGVALLPGVSVGGSEQWSQSSLRRMSGQMARTTTSETRSFSTSPSIAWELDLWGKLRAGQQAAAAGALASRFDQEAVALTVVTAVASTWFQALALQDRVAVAGRNLGDAEMILRAIQARAAAGTASSSG